MGLLDTLGPVLGMQPTPPPPQPPSDLLQQLMSLGSVDQRHKLLQSQFDMGGQLAQGAPVDYAHGKGTPLLLAGLANLVSAGLGGYQQGKATGGLRDLVTQTDAARTAGARAAMDSPTPDLSSLLTATPDQLPSALQGVKDMIQKQRNTGMALSMSGDPNLAPMGKSLYGDSDKAQQTVLGTPAARNELQMSGLDIAKRLRGAAVETSPVVGGAGAALLKKLGYSVPDGASPGEIAAILPQAEKVAAIPKVMSVAPGSDVVDARTGKKLSSGGGVDAMLSPEALDRQAALYNSTGSLPSFGRANPVIHGAIIRRAAELSNGSDLAGTQASFKGDSASLRKLQVQADSIDSFENTALKNLDNFLALGKQISDTGVPLANKPIRAIQESLAGSPAQAQFNAARTVAIQEISKVLGGAVAGGAVSDSQRHEVEGLMRGDATLEQLNAVAQTLKQDMANRKAAVSEQIATVKGRLGGKPAAAEPAPAAGVAVHGRFNPATGKVEPAK